MLLVPSSLPRVSVAWGCLVYRSPFSPSLLSCLPPPPSWVMHCAVVRVSGMLCHPSSQVMETPPRVHWYLPSLLVGWLLVFGLLGWLLGLLVGCWLIGFGTPEFAWLIGWLVGWFIGWLVVAVWCCCTVCLCVSMYVPRLQLSLGGLCTFHFGVLAAF